MSPCTTSGQEMERVNSYNPGAHTGHKVDDYRRRCLPISFWRTRLVLCIRHQCIIGEDDVSNHLHMHLSLYKRVVIRLS